MNARITSANKSCGVITGRGRQTVDLDCRGLVRLRIINGTAYAIEGLARQFGSLEPPGPKPVDITIHFTEDRPPDDLGYIGLNNAAYDKDGFYLLDQVTGSVVARIPFEQLGQPCNFVCFQHDKKVPLLFDAVRLTMMRKGFIALHASAFEYQGVGCLVMGWAYGGKTETMFAFAMRKARYVGDEWIILSRDGKEMFGMPCSLTIQDWQFPYVKPLLPKISRTQQAFFSLIRLLDASHNWLADTRFSSTFPVQTLARGLPRLRKQRSIKADPAAVFPESDFPMVRPNRVFLVQSHAKAETCVSRRDSTEVAERVAQSLTYERGTLLEHYSAFRFAFPMLRNNLLESAPERELKMLREALAGQEVYEVTHPYPVDFQELFAEMEPYCRPAMIAPRKERPTFRSQISP